MIRTLSSLCVYSYYLGQIPRLSVTDLELIKHISMKEFGYFTNREVSRIMVLKAIKINVFWFLQRFPDLYGGPYGLTRCRDKTWRTARQALSPTFSPFKMRAVRVARRKHKDSKNKPVTADLFWLAWLQWAVATGKFKALAI